MDIGADDFGERAALSGSDSFAASGGEFVFHLAEDEDFVAASFHAEAVARASHLGGTEDLVLGIAQLDAAHPFAGSGQNRHVVEGEVSDSRYDNYVQILEEVEEQKYWQRDKDV